MESLIKLFEEIMVAVALAEEGIKAVKTDFPGYTDGILS